MDINISFVNGDFKKIEHKNYEKNINKLPNEILVTIFLFLDLNSIKISNTICKKWKQLLERDLEKRPDINRLIYDEISCNNKIWEKTPEVTDNSDEPKFLDLVKRIIETFNRFCNRYPKQKFKLIWFPKELNKNSVLATFEPLAIEKLSMNESFDDAFKELTQKVESVTQSYWFFIGFISSDHAISDEETMALDLVEDILDDFQKPKITEMLVAGHLEYLQNPEQNFETFHVPCEDTFLGCKVGVTLKDGEANAWISSKPESEISTGRVVVKRFLLDSDEH